MSLHNRQTIIRCICLFVAGAALQLITGAIDPSFLAYPWGLIAAANYLYLLVIVSFSRDKWKWTEWLHSRAAYISSIVSMLLLTLVFGLVRQDGTPDGLLGMLGFTQMKSAWVFNLFLFYLMTVLGLRVITEFRKFEKRRLPVTVIHLSFFVILVAALFGSGDKMRVTVTAVQGEPVNKGVTKDGKAVMLPFTLRLKEFSMDEYPPHIHIYSGNNLTKEYVPVESEGQGGTIGRWQIECSSYLEMAGRMPGDSSYVPINHVGATTAVYLKATDGTRMAEGWVSCGSHIFPASTLALPGGEMLVMPQREAKRYLSQVVMSDADGEREYDIAVNSPATAGAWKIYQSAYDRTRGKWSTVSVLECVKDGWYAVVHAAMWLAMAVGATMFVIGNRQRKGGRK